MIDAPKSEEMARLERMYREESKKHPTNELERLQHELNLRNIAWALDEERSRTSVVKALVAEYFN
jgi:hypothetical protein